jgi:hypothetical protein
MRLRNITMLCEYEVVITIACKQSVARIPAKTDTNIRQSLYCDP